MVASKHPPRCGLSTAELEAICWEGEIPQGSSHGSSPAFFDFTVHYEAPAFQMTVQDKAT